MVKENRPKSEAEHGGKFTTGIDIKARSLPVLQ